MMRKSRFSVAFVVALVLAVAILPHNGIASSLRQETVSYVVRRGDNLSSIASRYGSSVSAIVQANRLANTVIWPGQTLVIPSVSASGQSTGGSGSVGGGAPVGGSHIVRRGESLWSIASRYGVSIAALRAANGLSGDVILPGQTLSIPSPSGASSASGSTSAVSSSRSSGCSGSYTVRPGDTLTSIAARCGVSVQLLREANGIAGSAIYRGQTLRIPSSMPAAPWPSASGSASTPTFAPPSAVIPAQPSVSTGGQQVLDLAFPTPVPPFPPLSYPAPGQ